MAKLRENKRGGDSAEWPTTHNGNQGAQYEARKGFTRLTAPGNTYHARSDQDRATSYSHDGKTSNQYLMEDPARYMDHSSNEARLLENRWRGGGWQLPEDDLGPSIKEPTVGQFYSTVPQDTQTNG